MLPKIDMPLLSLQQDMFSKWHMSGQTLISDGLLLDDSDESGLSDA